MTETEYMKLLDPIDKAEESTRPFLVQSEKENMVVGDPNETEVKKTTFQMTFEIPDENGERKTVKKEYPNVFIKPRKAPRITRVMSEILPFFRKVNEDGTVDQLTEADIASILSTQLPEYIYDEMYELVGTVLEIDERLWDYMLPGAVFDASMLIFRDISRIGE